MIIGIVGNKNVGKDTLADYLVKEKGFIKYAFADPLKEGLKEDLKQAQNRLHSHKA